jgi:hypothetical protein
MIRTLTWLVALAGSLSLLAACAPERPDAEPGAQGMERMAILASGTNGGTDILIMSSTGQELDRIETDLGSWTQGLAWHPDGFYLVGQGEYLYRVDNDGSSEVWSDPMYGGIFGVTANEEGEVTVGNAEDGVTKLDDEGEVLMHPQMGGTCFMDTAGVPGESGVDASIDIYGPRIVLADSESGTLQTVAEGFGWNLGNLAVDGSGRFYAGSYWDNTGLWLVDGDEITSIGELTDHGLEADWIVAMAGATHSSAYVMYDGMSGSAIAEVHADGRVEEVVAADAEVWTDLVVF